MYARAMRAACTENPGATHGHFPTPAARAVRSRPNAPERSLYAPRNRSTAMPHRPAGFTLVELIITCAILAIATGAALPSLSGLVEHHRTNAAVSALTSQMQLARAAAVSRNHRTVLCPSADGRSCLSGSDWSGGWMLFVDDDGNRRPDAGEDILRVEQTPTSRHLRIASSGGRQQLRYLPDGSSAGSNLTLSICNPRGQLLARVVVNNVGRPRSERAAPGATCPA